MNRIEKYFEEEKSSENISSFDKPSLDDPKICFRKWKDFFLNSDDDEDDEDDDYLENEKSGFISLHAIGGPFAGNVPDTNKLFNFFLVETNFGITMKMFQGIDNILGVESIDKVSPYKLRVSIGHLFNEQTVQSEISRFFKKCLESKNKT